MKYTKETIDAINGLSSQGLSGRKIAKKLGISKSGVNDYLKEQKHELLKKLSSGAKILVFDLETAADTALTFGRFKVNLSQDHIVKHGGYILCASWTWLGEDEIYSVYLTPEEIEDEDDSLILEVFYELYDEADAIVAYNSKGFDHKVLQTRAIKRNIILPKVKVLDPCILAKKHLRLASYKLDSVADFLGLGRKIDTGGIKLWKDVQSGDRAAMKEMVEYCVHDTRLLRDVYLKLRALGQGGDSINQALYYDDNEMHCPACGSTELERTGRTVKTSFSEFHEVKCNECGHRSRERKSITDVDKRASLLAQVV